MPRTYTNNYFLPEAFARAVRNDTYVKRGDISITGLIDSPRIRLLKKTFNYEEDVADSVWSVFGTAVHAIIERGSVDHADAICEIAMNMKIGPWSVTGTSDMYEVSNKTITDWKVTSVWKVKNGIKDTDSWVKQLNCYSAMLQNPTCEKIIDGQSTFKTFPVERINIVAILKDWKRREAAYNPEYPQTPVVKLTLPVYSPEAMLGYMNKRVELHLKEEQEFYSSDIKHNEDALSICSDDERWSQAPTWRMKTKGKKKSLKNFVVENEKDEQFAMEYFRNKVIKVPDLTIEKSTRVDMRCSEFCPVNIHCKYWNMVKHRYED